MELRDYRELAGQFDAVCSAEMIEAARRVVPANVSCQQGDIAEMTLPAGAYDAITSISALHHLSLLTVLPRLALALRPGGILIAIALYRADRPRDLPFEAFVAVASNAPLPARHVPAARRRARDTVYGSGADHQAGSPAGAARASRRHGDAPGPAALRTPLAQAGAVTAEFLLADRRGTSVR